MRSDTTLTLFIPDLFGFQSTLSQLSPEEKSSLPETQFPILEKWLSRGLREKDSANEDLLASEFGISLEKNKDKPYAALSLLAENHSIENVSDYYWLRADPVYMQADRDTVLLSAHEEIALTEGEATKLVEKINAHFIDEPWTLYSFTPQRWYMALEKQADLITSPITKVMGKNIHHYASTGDDAPYWLNITNEIQMLLHGSNVNFERESRNMITANSLWLWGGGTLPDFDNPLKSHDKIITNDILFSGVGHYCDLEILALDNEFINHIQNGNSFVVLDMLSEYIRNLDLYSFMQALYEIETSFLSLCNELLLNNKVDKIILVTDDAIKITVTKKYLRRWWKRIKPYTDFNNA